MEAKFSYTIVGAFVVTLGALLIGGVLWLTSGKFYGRSYTTYVTYIRESVAGLNLNAPVKYRGVDVGFVRGIALNPANVEEVELTLSIVRGTPVKVDTVAVLQSQGLTGIVFVDLTGGRNGSPPLEAKAGEAYPVIESGPSLFARLDTGVTVLIANLTRATDTFNAAFNDDNRRSLSLALADLRTLSHTLAARAPTIDAALANAARTTDNTARVSAELPGLVQRIESSADRFDRMSDSLARAGTTATKTLADTRSDLQRFTSEGLPELLQLIAELRTFTGTLTRVADGLERNPSVLVWGRPPARRGPGE